MIEVLDSIPVGLETRDVVERLRLRRENENIRSIVSELLEITRSVARPKAVYKVSFVTDRDADSLRIDGIRFSSHVLRVNLDKIERVFPCVVTCGRELGSRLPCGLPEQ